MAQTLLAFAFDADAGADDGVGDGDRTAERVRAGLRRVEDWYAPLWPVRRRSETAAHGRLGLQLWDDADEDCRWPSWVHDGHTTVATTHVPLGYTRVVGDVELTEAPLGLVRRLQQAPADVMQLTGPFVLAAVDGRAGSLTLLTDGLGLGRLYELRTPEGRVWSNRPVAALRFAGVRAEADPVAWRRMAACDWAMGDATPYRGLRTVPAATRIEVDENGHREQSQDVLGSLVAARRDPLTAESLSQTVRGLTDLARSVQSLWPGTPVLSLSGGRDSRLVVAAFLAAGIEVRLKTYGAAAGEADTARRLVQRLPEPVEHEVVTPVAQRVGGRRRVGAYQRARRWHDVTEGQRPALYLRNQAPKRLLRHRPALICGVGGEFGHAPGYPDDVERLERLPPARRLDAFARALQAKVVLPRGLSPRATSAVDDQVRRVLAHAADRHVTDSKALDWFYADERLRRWGMAGESPGRVMPLLVPEFVSAAFGLTTAQSNASALHRALIARLVPAWADLEFYSATLKERQAVRQQRLWEEADVDQLSRVFADDDWGDAFDVVQVRSVWRQAQAGRAAARDELLLQRVVWRAAFTDHLAAVNGEPPRIRPSAPAPQKAALGPDMRAAVRALAIRANDVPLARRLARTSFGRQLRRRLGV